MFATACICNLNNQIANVANCEAICGGPESYSPNAKKTIGKCLWSFLVGDGGFGPPKSVTTDLQSAPFGRSGNPPYGAGDRSRTNNLLITNQLLCH